MYLYKLLPEFLEYKKNGWAKNKTIREYDANLYQFFQYLFSVKKKKNKVTLSDIKLIDIEKYKSYLRTLSCPKTSIYWKNHEHLSTSTISIKTSNIKQFFRYYNLYHNRGVDSEKIEIPKYKSPEMTFVSDQEFQNLINSVEKVEVREDVKLRNKAFLYTVYTTWMRVSEVLNLRIDQNPKNWWEISISWKWDVIRTIYLNQKCKKYIDEYMKYRYWGKLIKKTNRIYKVSDKTDLVFVSMWDTTFGRKLSKQTICFMFQRYRKFMKTDKRITCHTLRHSFATKLLRGWTNIRVIQKLMWHQDIKTTERYTHVINSDLEREHIRVFGE